MTDASESSLDLRLPPIFRDSIALFSELGSDRFRALIDVLDHTDPRVSGPELLQAVAAADIADHLTERQLDRLVGFAIATRRLLETIASDVPTIAQAVDRAARGAKVEVSGDFPQLLERLLDTSYIALREKAAALAGEADVTLDRSRCLTDLRPMFRPDGGADEITGFIILHSLKLEVHGSNTDPIFLNATGDALVGLKDVLDRALRKEATLREFLKGGGWMDLTLRDNDNGPKP